MRSFHTNRSSCKVQSKVKCWLQTFAGTRLWALEARNHTDTECDNHVPDLQWHVVCVDDAAEWRERHRTTCTQQLPATTCPGFKGQREGGARGLWRKECDCSRA